MNSTQRRLKYVATINDEALGEDTPGDFEMQYVDISNVDSSGSIGELATYRFDEAPSRARRRVRDGDIIISTVRTYLQAIAQVEDPPENLIVSTGFAVVRPQRDAFDARYCKYALREPEFLAEVERRSVGVSYPAINASELGAIPVHVHRLPRQHAIADYLDRETARIDGLIAAKERVLELLAEKRRALTTRAITRGLDLHATLRNSGVPWLGEIPAHWEMKQAKFIFRQSALPIREDDEIVTCFRDGQVTLRRNRRLDGFTQADLEQGYQGIREGQLVLHSMDAFAGAIGVSDADGKCSPEYIICDPRDKPVDNHYYGHLLRTMALAGFIQASCPAVRERAPRIRFSDFGDMLLPLPPIDEQKNVVSMVAKDAARLDALQTATTRTIGLLKERRASLIAAAVTGQIDIGGAA